MEKIEKRLNKYLSEAGICSRRKADEYIAQGFVYINGVKASVGAKVTNADTVSLNGKTVCLNDTFVLLAFHKPKGIVCTAEKREKNNIMDYLHYPIQLKYIGRLDKDSEGLLLLTNNGDLDNEIQKARNFHEKEYVVTVNKEITPEFLKAMSNGVPILDTITRSCQVYAINKRTFGIVLTQGLNRQIRRMCEYFGYKVVKLKRIRVMNIELGDLPIGQYREVTKEEYHELRRLIDN